MKPIAVTLGDPSGIGPEITLSALSWFTTRAASSPPLRVYGPQEQLEPFAGLKGCEVEPVGRDAGPIGEVSAASGRLSFSALEAAIAAAHAQEVSALVTAPINKEAWRAAGINYPGHTEVLAERLSGGAVAMSFWGPKLRVALSTTHIPLRQVSAMLSTERVVEVGRLLAQALSSSGWARGATPKLGMAGLNPHAGEGGLFGDDEVQVLRPAIDTLKQEGIDVSDPIPADSVFRMAAEGVFDGVIAHYHDQALIPVKLVDFGDSANVTLGLSLPRCSPDHGTAFDIAGKGVAHDGGMRSALRWAERFSSPKSSE